MVMYKTVLVTYYKGPALNHVIGGKVEGRTEVTGRRWRRRRRRRSKQLL